MPEEKYYTIPQVAKMFQVSRQTVYNWLALGDLEAVYLRTDRRVTSTQIAAFIERSTARAALLAERRRKREDPDPSAEIAAH